MGQKGVDKTVDVPRHSVILMTTVSNSYPCRVLFCSFLYDLSPTTSVHVQALVTPQSVLIISKEEDAVNVEGKKEKKSFNFRKSCFSLKIKRFSIKDQSDSVFPTIEGR